MLNTRYIDIVRLGVCVFAFLSFDRIFRLGFPPSLRLHNFSFFLLLRTASMFCAYARFKFNEHVRSFREMETKKENEKKNEKFVLCQCRWNNHKIILLNAICFADFYTLYIYLYQCVWSVCKSCYNFFFFYLRTRIENWRFFVIHKNHEAKTATTEANVFILPLKYWVRCLLLSFYFSNKIHCNDFVLKCSCTHDLRFFVTILIYK